MIILNVITLICLILVEGSKIRIGNEYAALQKAYKNNKPQINCSPVRMTVVGFRIKMSDIVNRECWSTSSDIQMFALNKIFIDCDVIKNSTQFFIYAPTWETIGTRKIIVSGKNGEPHNPSTVRGFGKTGEPGLPGGAGGIFIGVGEHLINASNLTIEANGGNGGPGQNGAKGIDGIDGDEFKKEFTNPERNQYNLKFLLNYLKLNFSTTFSSHCSDDGCSSTYEYKIEGKNAISSGNGGDGGAGGLGGPAGTIYVSGFDTKPNWELVGGKNGTVGKGGFAGNPARNGRNAKCRFTYSLSSPNSVFYEWSDYTTVPNGQNGIDGGNLFDREEPPIAMSADYKAFVSKVLFYKLN